MSLFDSLVRGFSSITLFPVIRVPASHFVSEIVPTHRNSKGFFVICSCGQKCGMYDDSISFDQHAFEQRKKKKHEQ